MSISLAVILIDRVMFKQQKITLLEPFIFFVMSVTAALVVQ